MTATTDLMRIAERTMTYPFKVWGFGEGIALEALWDAASVLDEPEYHDFVLSLLDRWLQRPLQEPDHSAPGMLLLMAYEATSDARYLERAVTLAEYMHDLPRTLSGAAYHRPTHADYHHFIYVDCMEVDAPFLCKLALVTQDDTYRAAAIQQLHAYSQHLQDDETGLFYHQYDGKSQTVNGAFWGRGNGWALLGLVKTLLLLPTNHPQRQPVQARLRRLVAALVRLQAASGGWHTVLDDPSTYEEASLPAMFGYGIHIALTHSLIPDDCSETVQRARAAMDARLRDGTLHGVSVATPPGNAAHYNGIVIGAGFPWGQGPALLFALTAHKSQR